MDWLSNNLKNKKLNRSQTIYREIYRLRRNSP